MDILFYDNNPIAYEFRGLAESKNVIVVLHGLGASARQFEFMANLLQSECRLLLIDLPGHADVSIGENGPQASFNTYRDMVISLTKDLGITKAIFCGISMGAALSLMIAAARPDLVCEVLAIRPAWLVSKSPKNLALIARIGAWLEQNTVKEVLSLLDADDEYHALCCDAPRAANSVREAVNRPKAKEHSPVLKLMVADRPFENLSDLMKIDCPVTIVGTHGDELHPIGLAQQTAEAIPNAQLAIAPPRYIEPDAHAAALTALSRNALNRL